MISSALPGSKRGSSVSVAAAGDRGVQPAGLPEGVEQRQRPEHDGVGAEVEQAARDLARCGARLSWVSSAPFGVPVVPEV